MRNILIVLFLFMLNGCGVIDYYFLTPPEDTAQELYENARGSMQEKEYSQAIESLNKLNDQYPFSPYSVNGKIMLGDAYFLNKQYLEAVDVYEDFLSLHPRHEQIDYILLQIGVARYNAHPAIDLPQNDLAEAVETLKRLIETYPDSKYVPEAQKYVVKCRTLMAEHEMYVADFYYKSGSYKAAWSRYEYVVQNFPELEELVRVADAKRKVAFFEYQQKESEEIRNPSTIKKYFNWL